MEEISRKCNLCATLCSSCMHFEQVFEIVGAGTDVVTDKTYEEIGTSRCSSNDGNLFSPSLSKACSCVLHMSSEASYIFRKNISGSTVSDVSFPVVERDVNERHVSSLIADTEFDKANCNHRDAQSFTIGPLLAGLTIPHRADQSNTSSLKDFYDCAISVKGEPSEWSSGQVESSLAGTAIPELGRPIGGVFSCATFVGAVDPHSYCKEHLQKSVSAVKNTSVQESWQSQPAEPRAISDVMYNEVIVCDICGDAGRGEFLAICKMCGNGAEHIYCMRVKLDKVPEEDWMCEECMSRSATEKSVQEKVEESARIPKGHLDCQTSEISMNLESRTRSSPKLKFRSSYSWKDGTKGVSSTSPLSAQQLGAPLAQSVKKIRVIGMSNVPSTPSKSCNNALLCQDYSCKDLKNKTVKAAKVTSSLLQFSCSSQEKPKVRRGCGSKRPSEASKPSNQSMPTRQPPFKKLGKAKIEVAHSVRSVKQSSYGTQEKAKVPFRLGDQSQRLGPQAEITHDKCSKLKSRSSKATDVKFKEQLANGGCLRNQKCVTNLSFHENRKREYLRIMSKSVSLSSVVSEKSNSTCSEVLQENPFFPMNLKSSSSAEEMKTGKGKEASELHNPAMCSLASDSGVTAVKSGKKSMSGNEIFFSGSNCCKLYTVQSCHNAQKDLNYTNEEKKNESWQAELPTVAAAAMSNSQKLENRDIKSWALDLNAYPPDENDIVRVDEIGKFDIIDPWSSGDRIFHGGDNYNSSCSYSSQALDKEDKKSRPVIIDLKLSLWPESATPEDDPSLCAGTADYKTKEDVHGKLMMDEENGIHYFELSNEENMDLLERQAVDTLVFISNTSRKI